MKIELTISNDYVEELKEYNTSTSNILQQIDADSFYELSEETQKAFLSLLLKSQKFYSDFLAKVICK